MRECFPNVVNLVRYGMNRSLPERYFLHAGPLNAVLENGALKYIKFGDTEIVREIYIALRDQNWDTIVPAFQVYEVEQCDDGFCIRLQAMHKNREIEFLWNGEIVANNQGQIHYVMEGHALQGFLRNRLGFCVLHPLQLAGTEVAVNTPESEVHTVFPVLISPHQPITDIQAMRYQLTPGVEAEIQFEGDLFEMEDHRNWTDASFKTYCTPLRLPYPVQLNDGDSVRQAVTLTVRGASVSQRRGTVEGEPLNVRVSDKSSGSVPALGVMQNKGRIPAHVIKYLQAAHIRHLRVELDLEKSNSHGDFEDAISNSNALCIPMEVAVIAGEHGEGLEEFLSLVRTMNANVTRLFVFSRSAPTTTENLLSIAKKMVHHNNLNILVGGGSRVFFAEFNRAELPHHLMDVVTYPITPQVHAVDLATIIDNLSGQAPTVATCRKICGDVPLSIGPITFKTHNFPGVQEDACQHEIDRRQMSLFGAGWTVGSIRRLGEIGVEFASYYEAVGERGVMSCDGSALFPVYHILNDINEYSNQEVLTIDIERPDLIDAIALRAKTRMRVVIANLSNYQQVAKVSIPLVSSTTIRYLDETSALQAMVDKDAFRAFVHQTMSSLCDEIVLTLRPFGIATIDANLDESQNNY